MIAQDVLSESPSSKGNVLLRSQSLTAVPNQDCPAPLSLTHCVSVIWRVLWVLCAPPEPQSVWFHRLGGRQKPLMMSNLKLLHPPPMGGPLDASCFACSDTSDEGDEQEETPGILEILH